MFNPVRRNRNIGTSKQGHGQSNKLTIASSCVTSKSFYECLDNYEKTEININGHDFIFVVEQTRPNCQHACSISDLVQVIENIPEADYGELQLIILRQPKRKEELVSPVWGRFIYSFEFENAHAPAIIIEAIDYSKKLKWSKKLPVESQRELERLKADGHKFISGDRHFVAELKPENVRHTQLYRTLLHEFGHYVQYLEVVERPAIRDEAFEIWEQRNEMYFKISRSHKEAFAHRYADNLRKQLSELNIFPIDPI